LKIAGVTLTLLLAGLVTQLRFDGESRSRKESVVTRIGDAQNLLAAYNQWKATAARNGADRRLVLPLRYSKGLSAEFTKADGHASLNLIDGSVSIKVAGLSDKEAFDVWLIDNRPGPGQSVKPEPGDVMVRIGRLTHKQGTATLQARLDRETTAGFKLDLVVVARAGENPGDAGLLVGSPTLFQRLYYSEQGGEFARLADTAGPGSPDPANRSLLSAPFRFLVPSPVYADGAEDITTHLGWLIAQGENLFFNETFEGNGRTCGSCHPAENNLTLDSAFIATLPNDDPLFVAEFNPNLATNFENPKLMREFGLILENVDGFDDLANKFVMRGVPHTLALATSIASGSNLPPLDRTGWSGDGAPGNGTLREFATGAVRQHFTKTLNRVAGVDFRLPTDEELDAMEAFQLSSGRQADLDLSTLHLKSAVAQTGLQIFTNDNLGKCNTCHLNAGATAPFAPGVNSNFDTGVEDFSPHPARLTGEPMPRDGGFGQSANDAGAFGDGTFNTPVLVEAADTGPFFHNNLVATIEEAVDFYNSAAFNSSPSGAFLGGIQLAPDQVQAVAAFLRVINALENIRSSKALLGRALQAQTLKRAQDPLLDAIAEQEDAIQVQAEKGLNPKAVLHLKLAKGLTKLAAITPIRLIRNGLIRGAIAEEELARKLIVDQG
jgi:hypothetical protein